MQTSKSRWRKTGYATSDVQDGDTLKSYDDPSNQQISKENKRKYKLLPTI